MKHEYDLYTAEQTRELDRLAIEQCGISGYELMQRAGQSAFERICQQWPDARQLAIFCGAGNNAGDGYVVARLAIQAASPQGWHRYVGLEGDVIGMTGFGASAPGSTLFEKFGFTSDNIVTKAKSLLSGKLSTPI